MERLKWARWFAWIASSVFVATVIGAIAYRDIAIDFVKLFRLMGLAIGPFLAVMGFIWGLVDKFQFKALGEQLGKAQADAERAEQDARDARAEFDAKEARIKALKLKLRTPAANTLARGAARGGFRWLRERRRMRNFYDVLAIDPGADDEHIKEAFQSLAKVFHPDLNLGEAVAERRFKETCQAYSTLKDHRTRAACELGLAHQRRSARRRISTAAMTGFATSMLSTIVIALMMVWPLTDGRQSAPSGQNRDGEGQPRKAAGALNGKAFAPNLPMLPRLLS